MEAGAARRAALPDPGDCMQMNRKKILVVDDSSTSLMWQQMILRQEPYDVITAKDGEEGVATATRETPDLILMDVVMPKKDGLQAVQEIRATPGLKGVPIIMVTTRSEARNVELGYKSGCSDYITKPIDRLELLSKVKSLLGS